MNEQELIKLWNSGALHEIPEINLKRFTKEVNSWQRKLRRNIEMDFLVLGFVGILVLVLGIFDPRIFIVFPIFVGTSIWYVACLRRINRNESNINSFESTKEFLATKKLLLSDFIRKNRVFTVIFMPFIIFGSLLLSPELRTMFTDLTLALFCIAFTVVVSGVGYLLVEILLRIAYVPSLDSLEELLEQLED